MSLFQIKIVFQEKSGQLTQVHMWLSSRQTSCVSKQHRCCVHTAHPAIQIIFKNLLLNRFNKINNFHCFIKNILKWNGPFWNFVCWCMLDGWGSGWRLVPLLDLRWGTSTFPTCFDSAMLNVGTVKKANSIFIFLSEVVLTFGAPWKGLRDPLPGALTPYLGNHWTQ